MLKQILVNRVVVEKNEQTFEFHMPVNADLGLAYDAAYEMFVVIGKNIEERNKKAEEDSKMFEENSAVEEVVVEEVVEKQ